MHIKKTTAVNIILLISLGTLFFILGGCESTTNSSQQQKDTAKTVEQIDSNKYLKASSGDIWRRIDFPSPSTGYFWPSFVEPIALLKTTDGGTTWLPLSYTGGIPFVLRFYNDNIGLLCAKKIWRTLDGGTSWESFVAPYSGWGNDIRFDPTDASRVWMTDYQKLFFSNDTGRTWSTVTFADTGSIRGRNIVMTSSLTGWLLCDGRVYKTINGADWNRIETIPAEFNGTGMALDAVPGGTAVFSTNRKTFKTTDGGVQWLKISERGFDDDGTITVKDNTHFWSGTFEGRIYNTIDGGTTWNLQYGDTTKTIFFNYIKFFDLSNGIAMGDPTTDSLFNPTSPTLFVYTTNGGATWIQRVPTLAN